MNTTWSRRLAPVIDAAILILFVAIGRDQHHLGGTGIRWFLTVLWPLAAGWAVGALVTRLYTSKDQMWLRLLGTIAVGVFLQGILRGLFTNRPYYSTFTIVAFTFLSLATFGWRLVGLLIARRRRTVPAS